MWRFLTRTLKDFGNFFKQIAVKIVVAIIVGINLSTSYGTFISFLRDPPLSICFIQLLSFSKNHCQPFWGLIFRFIYRRTVA